MDDIYILEKETIPHPLRHIPQPPSKLYVKGRMPAEDAVLLCVVGAREHSSYGEEVCKKLIAGLKGYSICIVSGLAIGIDGIAHRAALEAGLHTIAFPGSGLDSKVLYPAQHARLAEEIVYAGGTLISEFKMDQIGASWTFPQRNRLMAGISKATLVIEAELQSGTLITSRLATDYNRDVGAVPGNIFSPLSAGPHMLIRNGATPITCSDDILEMLGFERRDGMNQEQRVAQANLFAGLNENEKRVIEILQIEPRTTEQLVQKTGHSARIVSEIISSLEVQGLIEEGEGGFRVK